MRPAGENPGIGDIGLPEALTVPGRAVGNGLLRPDVLVGAVEDTGPGFDAAVPDIARLYSYWLGGKDHFAAERVEAERLEQILPGTSLLPRANRAFVGTAVRYVAGQGISQFLDVGCGLPTSPSVHEIARDVVPGARVVYADNDPTVLSHARALLAGEGVGVVEGDLRNPAALLDDSAVTSLLGWDQPACVLLTSVLHFVPAGDAGGVVVEFCRRLALGSYLIISVGRSSDPELVREFSAAYKAASLHNHSRGDIEWWVRRAGLEMVEPGLTDVWEWQPDDLPGGLPPAWTRCTRNPLPDGNPRATILGAVARKPRHEGG
jgi:hypothetical protein